MASKVVMLETVFHFLDFLNKADPLAVTDLEILTHLSRSKNACSVYIPMHPREKGYRGYRMELQKAASHCPNHTFKLMDNLAKRPGQVVTQDEIDAHLWPEYASGDRSDHPYDRQFSDHKRKIIVPVGKAMENAQGWESAKTNTLITTKRKIGYVLNVTRSDVFAIV